MSPSNFNKLVSVCVMSLAFGNSFSQNTGFYGRKLFVEFNSASQVPLVAMAFKDRTYDTYGYGITSNKADKFNTGFSFVFGGATSSRSAISLEAGMYYASITPPRDNESYFLRHENFNIRTFTIMPKIEIAGNGGTSPGGLTHQIGFGFNLTKVANKDYDYILSSEAPDSIGDPAATTMDFSQRYKGFTFMYAIVMRVPINKRLLFNYGLRYTANFPISSGLKYSNNDGYWASTTTVASLISKTRALSLINLQIGFSFML